MIIIFAIFATLLLGSCTAADLKPEPAAVEQYAARYDWMQAIRYYRIEVEKNPDDADSLRGYRAAVEKAVAFHRVQAQKYASAGEFAAAEVILAQGLEIIPDSQELRDELERVRNVRSARLMYQEAAASARLGRNRRALESLEKSLSLDPDYADALALYKKLREDQVVDRNIDPIRLKTGAPVTINFKNASFKDAMLALGSTYGLNVIFDPDVEDRPISIHAENVEFGQALALILKSNKSFYRRLGSNSIVIAPDTTEGRAEYEDYAVRTFYLTSMPAADMATLLTTSLGVKNVSVNSAANSVTARDSRERLILADKLVEANDRPPAEVLLEVEILEVNRTKSEQLGVDYGSQIVLDPPAFNLNQLTKRDGIDVAGLTAVSLPSLTLRYFKQDVDAKILASPRIRTVDKQEAHIHIGDRVPLRSSTIQDATGQTRTTFNYEDIGIKLTVTPEVKLSRKIMMNISLEVSSLGQNLGTAQEPAYAIGTRNVKTRMMLEDAETAVIGGLIRDEERDTVQRVPGLGDIPRIGKLFQSHDGQGTRSDILLTLTPRIIRARDVPSAPEAEFTSGNGNRVSDGGAVDFIVAKGAGGQPVIHLDLSGGSAATLPVSKLPSPLSVSPKNADTTAIKVAEGTPALAFSSDAYSVKTGDQIAVVVQASGFADKATATIRFRPDLLEVSDVQTVPGVSRIKDAPNGTIELALTPQTGGAQRRDIATITFKGTRPGLSYLVFSNPLGSGDDENGSTNVQLQSSRIAIR